MQKEIEAVHVELTPEWRQRVEQEIARIAEHHPEVVHRMRVTITAPTNQRLGLFEVGVVASVPGDAVVVKNTGEFVMPLIVETFESLDRRLKEHNDKKQQMVKRHAPQPEGSIMELVPMEDYGRIEAADGSLVYFHRNAVKDADFDELKIGDRVEFREEMGDKGPQAAWVRRR